jgi:hypothetical protein
MQNKDFEKKNTNIKLLLKALVIFFITIDIFASPEQYFNFFIRSKVKISVMFSEEGERKLLLIKSNAYADALNDYVVEMIRQNKIPDKNYHIFVPAESYVNNYYDISRSKKLNFISMKEHYFDLEMTILLINFFASNEWKSFCLRDYHDDYECIQRKIERMEIKFINYVKEKSLKPDMDFYKDKYYTPWEKEPFKIVFHLGKFSYYFKNKEINYEPLCFFPINIKDRYIIVSKKGMKVFSNDNELLDFQYDIEKIAGQYRNFYSIINEQVIFNFSHGDRIIYSYKNNQFQSFPMD